MTVFIMEKPSQEGFGVLWVVNTSKVQNHFE